MPVLLLLIVYAALSHAGTPTEISAPSESGLRVTGYAEVVVLNRYIYHGLVLEDQGATAQPYVLVSAEVYKGKCFLNSAAVNFSFFSSFESNAASAMNSGWVPNWWSEIQLEPGIELSFGRDFELSAVYRYFDSPSSAFDSAHEAELTLTLDDSHFLGKAALHPHVTWTRSIKGESGIGDSQGSSYYEVGIAPAWDIVKKSSLSMTVTAPIAAGLGDGHYYAGDRFGFLSAGVAVTVPLAFIQAGWGEWKLGVSGTYYYLGRNLADVTNSGKRNTNVMAITFSTEF